MAKGFVNDDAVQEQIDATVADAVARARSRQRRGPGLAHCEACGAPIPEGRRKAVPGVRSCVTCQAARDSEDRGTGGFNRRGSKDSQLR
jgi:phage/conjugal plasmid C-4 type zinc finger TraR family protein